MKTRLRTILTTIAVVLAWTVVRAGDPIPLPEHPRPDFERAAWMNLNGPWQFRFDKENAGLNAKWFETADGFADTVIVPFPWGSALSKIDDRATLGWYMRTVHTPKEWENQRVFVVI